MQLLLRIYQASSNLSSIDDLINEFDEFIKG